MAKLYNRVKVNTSTTGTGTVTLGAASSNAFCTFAEAGVANADVVAYVIEEGNDFEIGIGTYTSSGTTLSRDTVTLSKIGGTQGTSKMNLAGSATVRITARKEDLLSISDTQTANTFFSGPSSGSAAAPAFRAMAAADLPTGTVLQCLQNTYVTSADLTTALPIDDTVPQSTEGAQILSQAITPADNTNKVLCFGQVMVGPDNTNSGEIGVALFRGSTCIWAGSQKTTVQQVNIIAYSFLDSPASASAQTYTVRVGNAAGNIMRCNGIFNSRRFGGASACTLTVMEIAA
jgi:hypothetical protein